MRWLTLISPAELLRSGGAPDPDALAAIDRRDGLEIVGPPPEWS